MAAIHGLGMRFATLTVTFDAGAVNDVRVNAGTEAFAAPASGKFRRSLLVVSDAGVVAEVAGADAASLAAAVAPDVPADKIALAVVELDDDSITGLDLTVAGDTEPV